MRMSSAIRRSSAVLIVVLVVGLSVAAGCGSDEPTASARAPGLKPSASAEALTAHLAGFPKAIAAGASAQGTLVIVNQSGSEQQLQVPPNCAPNWAIGLRNDRVDAVPVPVASCDPNPLVLAPGETRLPASITARYATCGGSGGATPACEPGGGMPPLPAGEYEIVVIGLTLDVPPVAVTVTGGVQPAPEARPAPKSPTGKVSHAG